MAAKEYAFDAIGTRWSIILPQGVREEKGNDALAAVRERIAQFDQDYSRFRDDSWVCMIAKDPGTYTLPNDAQPLFDLYRDLYEITHGAVTPLIGDTLIAAGYDAAYSLLPKKPRAPYTWEEALEYTYPVLTIKKETTLDVGAAGKGYLVDIVSELLRNRGISSFVINAGGDICAYDAGGSVTRVALEHLGDPTQAIGVAQITNASICGSAGNRRAWSTYTHIIDPHTLTSPQHLLAVWVVAQTTLLADALTTALFFVDPATLLARYSFDYLLLRPDYSIERSASFPAELFLA
jgi:thiamine biosynthesis lipoprotein